MLQLLGELLTEMVGSVFAELLPHQPKSTLRGIILLLLSLGCAGLGLWVSAQVMLDRPGWLWTPLAFIVWGLSIAALLGALQAFGLISSGKH